MKIIIKQIILKNLLYNKYNNKAKILLTYYNSYNKIIDSVNIL